MDEIIIAENLVKDYPIGGGNFRALNGISLKITSGEFTGIIGPSGSGKTTLLNIFGALDNPTEGSATVLGKQVEKLSHKEQSELRKNSIGFIFQTFNLLPIYSVYENVEFPLLLAKIDDNERDRLVREAIDHVGLTDKIKSRPDQLSGGESQRVAIARAIVKQPKLVLADEPTANLDAKNSFHILDTMVKLNEVYKTTFLFSTHDEKVISCLRRVVTLNDGRIVADEKKEKVEVCC